MFVAAAALRPIEPGVGLRITAQGRPGNVIFGQTRPELALGHWPDPVWLASDLEGAMPEETRGTSHHGLEPRRIGFQAATLVALEPSWRWFGPRGQAIESIFGATLSQSAAQLRAAGTLAAPPAPIVYRDPRAPLAWQLARTLNTRLVEKVEREDPSAGHWEMYGGGCVNFYEFDDRGWQQAEWATLSAARAVLAGEDGTDSGEVVMNRWRSLVGRMPTRAGRVAV